MEMQRQQTEALMALVTERSKTAVTNTKFCEFDPTSELWTDYWSRYLTFTRANSIPAEKMAEIFLTNQSSAIFKLLTNIASQQDPPRDVNSLSMEEIQQQMMDHYNPKRFVVRERYRFWTHTERRPGENAHELAARIRQEAATCDFSSIKDPLDEAMRTRFVCSINNEATIKALFKVKDDELTFNRAIEIAAEVEEAAKVAKETLGTAHTEVFKLGQKPKKPARNYKPKPAAASNPRPRHDQVRLPQKRNTHSTNRECYRCNGAHDKDACRFKDAVCDFCGIKGHIQKACRKKKRQHVKHVTRVKWNQARPLLQTCYLQNTAVNFEVDTGSRDCFISQKTWDHLNRPKLSPISCRYKCASNKDLPVIGAVNLQTSTSETGPKSLQTFVVTTLNLNLRGRTAIRDLGLSVDKLIHSNSNSVHKVDVKPDLTLQKACKQLCSEFPDLFRPELGTFKDLELEVKFKPDSSPVFHKPRPVPIAIQEDLELALQAGISKGIWQKTRFNPYGTPVVPIKKASQGQNGSNLRICGDYSVTVNPQLEPHRHPMPSPEDLMRKLGHGHGFTKIDLANAYNQIQLGPESQKKLAISTHKGVLLQKRLPFGISSAPGYFQEIMDRLTQDLPGVAVYLDDILVSGDTAEQHLSNLRGLFQRLQDTGLRCKMQKCAFAQPRVEYLGHYLSRDGISKGPKADAIQSMPAPSNVSSLRSFLGQVQFYSKFLPNISTTLEPLYRLTKKEVPWQWGTEEQTAFQNTKDLLGSDTVLAHFDTSLEVGISCDASDVGIGAVLFHRYSDGSERPIANASKTMSPCQRKYSQIQKEALAIIFALNKFHQFLYGRQFILVTDHKPLIALFGPTRPIPALAANRLARWALTLSQYDYKIEYRRTSSHGNADALSRLPSGPDATFDKEEAGEDSSTICTIQMISPADPEALVKESKDDPVLSTLMTYIQHGWPKEASGSKSMKREPWSTQSFRNIKDNLTVSHDCVFYGSRVVIPKNLQRSILNILHLGHFGIQRMKQLARTAVYWPSIDTDIMHATRGCVSCAENQNMPPKQPVHPWIMPDRPWERVHIDHAVNFKGHNWLVMVDAFSKYPCIHQMSSITTKATIRKLDEDFAHFGYPHTIVSDNAQCFSSAEFTQFCTDRGIHHVQGAPYHPETNGAAERLVQSFKKSLTKSSLHPTDALQEFLIQYRRTPLPGGSSPSELLNGRQIRAKIDIILPNLTKNVRGHPPPKFDVRSPCYVLSFRRGRKDKWLKGEIVSVIGHRLFNVKVLPEGPIWRRHTDQLRPRHLMPETVQCDK